MSKFFDWKENIEKDELKEVCKVINNNGVIVFPTETVYGVGGNALSSEVVKRIYEIKCRPRFKALNIMVKNKEEIQKYAYINSSIEEKIIENFMPGPITIILKKKENIIAKELTAENDTIGIRIPNNYIIKTILENCNVPIAAPSANISGKPSVTNLNDIKEDFCEKVDVMIDGGECKDKIASTIVQVVDGKIKILREGKITIDEINKIL